MQINDKVKIIPFDKQKYKNPYGIYMARPDAKIISINGKRTIIGTVNNWVKI